MEWAWVIVSAGAVGDDTYDTRDNKLAARGKAGWTRVSTQV